MSEHIPFARLNAFVEGRLLPAENQHITTHLADCSLCATEVAWLRHTGYIAGAGSAATPAPAKRRLQAELLFDSARQAPDFAVRNVQASSRQLLYRAAEYDLELRIAPLNNAWQISGQLLSPPVPGYVTLLDGVDMEYGLLSEEFEWKLPPVPPGSFTLVLHTDDAEVQIAGLELGV